MINHKCADAGCRLYCYSVELSFDHSLPTGQLEKIFEEIVERYTQELPRKIEFEQVGMKSFERSYVFYLYVEEPKKIFTIHPKFVREITEAWDKKIIRLTK